MPLPIFKSEELRDICTRVLEAVGAPSDEAKIVSDLMVEANLCGVDSHGVVRLVPYVKSIQKGHIKPGVKVEVVRETLGTALLNGNWGFGQVIGTRAMEIAIHKAENNGIGSVTVFNCNHVGRLTDYSMMAVRHDMIGFTTLNCAPSTSVAPFGGTSGVIGTNPICFAIPANQENPIVLDMTTSTVAHGRIKIAFLRHERIPEGWIIDSEGRPTTDPGKIFGSAKGAILPLGGIVGYKGFGLALVAEVLAGALSGSVRSEELSKRYKEGSIPNGLFLITINISSFLDIDEFKNRIDELIRHVKNTARVKGNDNIIVPGEPEYRERLMRIRNGVLIEDETWEAIKKVHRELGLKLEK
ncbi:MAG: Ldh family oxidoreductase [Nitrososphaeria archaeon]|nr:Ldh family oxidoreductase [Nitrososphaeria archaeon]NIN52334.1 Ldh family oxidoreductase [Nitrososphaeria archaeon]NIQ32812.1 Ldh family oxidoreductase [Nitrososphaeria archaeon]